MSSARPQDTKLIHKNQLYFWTLTVNTPKMKETSPCRIVSKRIKYLGINFIREGQDSDTENCKALLRLRNIIQP